MLLLTSLSAQAMMRTPECDAPALSPWRLPIGELNVHRPLTAPTSIVFDVEFEFLALLEGVERAARERRVVDEDLPAVLRTDESEATIPNHAYNGPSCHHLTACRHAELRATSGPPGTTRPTCAKRPAQESPELAPAVRSPLSKIVLPYDILKSARGA